jgi:hypothetical protein
MIVGVVVTAASSANVVAWSIIAMEAGPHTLG